MEYLGYVLITPFSFWSQLLFPKKKKKGGVGGGNVRSLRLKNWLPPESTIIYKVLDHNTLKICYIVNLDHFLLNIELECI